MIEPWGYQEVQGYVGNESREPSYEKIEELKKTKVDGAEYKKDENKITLTAEGKEVASIDTTDFVKDGMIESVELDGTVLKMVFNTDAGKEEIDIDFKDIVSGVTSYTKDEIDSMLDEKADKTDIPSLDEYAKTADVKTEIDNAVSGKADASDVYVKSEVDTKLDEKADKSDIPSMDEYAKTADVQAEIDNAVSGKADTSDVEAVEAQIAPISSDITALKGKADELQAAIDLKASQADFEALSSNVYTKQESDERFLTEHQSLSGYATEAWVDEQGFLTEHQDISNLATKDEVESGLADLWASLNLAAEKIDTKADADAVYTKDEVDAMLAEKQAEIDAIKTDYAKLKDIVGDIGGAVEYSVPADGKLTDMLKKSGIIKLTEDVESNTYTGGITSKNITTLNLNGKTITTTANTTTNPSIMVRGTQQFTIQGSGTLNANGHIVIEANGENAVITLGGTSFGRPTYVTNREGELIYCYLGTINITNGVFRNDNENKKFLLNCYDANYQNGTAKIVVTGGKFYDFDPANNTSEGEGTSYVPEGYVSVESTETIDGVEHTVYTVKKG